MTQSLRIFNYVNLKEFSSLLKLSPTTVSRALNGYPEVSETTRERVLAAAKEYHYRPSHHAKSLAGGATKSIGHIVALGSSQIIDPHYADFIAGASEVYGQYGYDLNLASIPLDKEKETYLDYVRKRKVDGIIIQVPEVNDWRIDLLRESNTPFVVHGRSDAQVEDYSLIDVNNRSAFERITNYLIELGHQSIALVNGLETLNFAKRRRDGFQSALLQHDLTVDQSLCFEGHMTLSYGYQSTIEILKRATNKRPTALLFASALPALGAYRAITESGLRMPDDISIATFDDALSFMARDGSEIPFFTSVRSSISEHGKQAARQLITQINNPELPVEQTIWEAELIIGRSTRAIR